VLLARGGNGGWGNARFKTSVNQAPRRSNPGEPGEERWLWLRLKLIADAGLIGLPNAGKSTFLRAVSAATPKVAAYPFTTLHPHLGVVEIGIGSRFVLADIPGLIEGAAEGAGLGHKFLGHVERCRVLLHLIDGTEADVVESWRTVRRELKAYDPEMARRKEIVALNKVDALSIEEIAAKQAALQKACRRKPLLVSGVTGHGVREAIQRLWDTVQGINEAEAEAAGDGGWEP
jgi:GTP-binding protein